MTPYSAILTFHLGCAFVATAASGMTLQSALRLRAAGDLAEAHAALGEIRRIVPVFPLATLGLIASGAYLTQTRWSWTSPWILASIAGLALISLFGSVVEGGRMRQLGAELGINGFTPAARRLANDPVAWMAKSVTLTLLGAVVMEMTLKPGGAGAGVLPIAALAAAAPLGRWFVRSGQRRGLHGGEAAISAFAEDQV